MGHVLAECSFDPVSSCLLTVYYHTDATDWTLPHRRHCLDTTTPTPLTGIRRKPCATPHWGGQSGRLAGQTPNTKLSVPIDLAISTPRPFAASAQYTGSFLPARKTRLPQAFSHQVCPVAWCPSRHGKEAQSWTTKQGLKTHVEVHSTGLLHGQVPGQWLADGSLDICPGCSRLISSRTRRCCARCFPAFQ